MEESRLDLYRAGAPLDRMLERLKEAERCFDAALEARSPPPGKRSWPRAGSPEPAETCGRAALPDYAEAIRRLPTSPSALLARGHVLLEHFMNEAGHRVVV